MAEQAKEIINVLWTGGWDSTFRVLSLAHEDVIVQPFYLTTDRKSTAIELETMAKIHAQIVARAGAVFELRPLRAIAVEDIHADKEISAAYQRLLKQMFMGSQYEILAWLAKDYPGLELAIHRDDKAFEIIQKFGAISHESNAGGDFAKVDRGASTDDLVSVFGNFHFPLLELTKLDMKCIAEDGGFLDLMNQTWFCHSPRDGESCGLCNPCKYSIEEGMEYRFSKKALTRYKYRNFINFPKRVVRKLRRIVKF